MRSKNKGSSRSAGYQDATAGNIGAPGLQQRNRSSFRQTIRPSEDTRHEQNAQEIRARFQEIPGGRFRKSGSKPRNSGPVFPKFTDPISRNSGTALDGDE